MELEEAIKHYEEIAKENDDAAKEFYRVSKLETRPDREYVECVYVECKKCADEHRQLAEWLKELKERREKDTQRLDDAISNVAYILDALRAYRNIVGTGDCNRCKVKKGCEYVPKPGQLVRYNCPFYKRSEDE